MIAAKKVKTRRVRVLLVVLVGCACLIAAALAWASETFTVSTHFTPYKLGAATNLSATTTFKLTGAVPTPVTNVLAFGPAGLNIDVIGTGVCQKRVLEQVGPSGCPADSRIGFGGGVGQPRLDRTGSDGQRSARHPSRTDMA